MSAANTVVENGGRVVLLDKSSFCGGNSTKATSGINGAGTKTQKAKGIPDNADIFTQDQRKRLKKCFQELKRERRGHSEGWCQKTRVSQVPGQATG